jgi:hypothetical protein
LDSLSNSDEESSGCAAAVLLVVDHPRLQEIQWPSSSARRNALGVSSLPTFLSVYNLMDQVQFITNVAATVAEGDLTQKIRNEVKQ